MGTTLTGTTPQDTYDSLIKVTDNGPLTGSLKKLTDGLGNDSSLSLSTTAASLSGTLAVTGAVTAGNNTNVQATSTNTRLLVTAAGVANTVLGFNNSGSTENGVVNNAGYVGILQDYPLVVTIADGEKMRITGAGNVGIGTSTPAQKLHVWQGSSGVSPRTDLGGTIIAEGSTRAGLYILTAGTDVGSYGSIWWGNGNANTDASIQVNNSTRAMQFYVADVERFRITPNGVTFNGDTAAANALDDYEEGTWTMGVSFGGASVGVTTSVNTGTYTKIGRQVTVNGFIVLTSKGSSTGDATITGLPFTVGNYSAPTLRLENITFTNQFQGYADVATTLILLQEVTILGANTNLTNADFANNSSIMVSATYFV
jgi:hypothetical protein